MEKLLFKPVKDLLENAGYEVKAEVKNADVVAVRDNDIAIVELKQTINLKLLYQATERQKITDNVFIAIPKPTRKIMFSKSHKEKIQLVRRLQIGLMYVDKKAEVIFEPKPFHMNISRGKSRKNTNLLISEFNKRDTSLNIGGAKGKIVTAYKEAAIKILLTLENGELSTKEIKELTKVDDATRILYKNFYGWFEGVSRGVYKLSKKGKKVLNSNDKVIEYIKKGT